MLFDYSIKTKIKNIIYEYQFEKVKCALEDIK